VHEFALHHPCLWIFDSPSARFFNDIENFSFWNVGCTYLRISAIRHTCASQRNVLEPQMNEQGKACSGGSSHATFVVTGFTGSGAANGSIR
jgi:hypothetical protein